MLPLNSKLIRLGNKHHHVTFEFLFFEVGKTSIWMISIDPWFFFDVLLMRVNCFYSRYIFQNNILPGTMGAPLFPTQNKLSCEEYWIWGPVILTKTANFRTIHKLTGTLYLSSQCRQPTIQHFLWRKVPRSLGKTEGPQQNHQNIQ